MIKLNSSTIVSFPTCAEWAEYYGKFREALVASLSGKFCLADREDAVEEAFHKLMHKKDVEAYGENVPKTEAEWYWNLRWQARSFLSHMQERVVRHAKYVERASKDLSGFFACGFQGYAMDLELRSRTLVRALEIFREEQDVSRRNLKVYEMRMAGIPAKDVAKRFDISANNVDQIKHRIEILLKKHGQRCFARALRKEAGTDVGLAAA